jgi:hypothetical protein
MAFQKEHADAFRDLIARFESEAGANAIVDAIAAALTEEGERLYEDGAYIRGDHYSNAARELRNYLDRGERTLNAKDNDDHIAANPEVGIRQGNEAGPITSSAVSERANEYPDLAANPDPVGVAVRMLDGGVSVHLGDDEWEDIDRTPGAFTAVRLWPHDSNGLEEFRLYDHTGKQVAHAGVVIIGADAHVANIEAEDGANTLGIKALRTLRTKLTQDFPEVTVIKGLRYSGATPGRIQEIELRPVTLAEHEDELRAELRGNLDPRERETIRAELEATRAVLKEQEHRHDQLLPAESVHHPAGPGRTQEVGLQNANESQRSDVDMEMPAREGPNALTGRIEVHQVPLRRAADPLTPAEQREFNSLLGRIQDGEDVGDYGSARLCELRERDAGYAERLQAEIEEKLFDGGPDLSSRTELRGTRGNREHETIAAELKPARALLNEQDPLPTEGIPRSDIAPTRLGAADFEMHRPEVDAAAARLSAETGLPYTPAVNGEFVAGIYRESLTTSSGRFAVIDNGLGFALVPWTQELDRHLGQHVSGVAKESGGVEWSFGRKRGIEI